MARTKPTLSGALFAALLLGAAPYSHSADLPPVVERYEQMLVKSPQKGTAFDRIYQHFFEGEGLEKLTERWRSKAAGTSGGEAAAYELLLGMLAERIGKPNDARDFYTLSLIHI